MIHTRITPTDQTASFNIPKEYVGREIEVIAFAKEEGQPEEKIIGRKNLHTKSSKKNERFLGVYFGRYGS